VRGENKKEVGAMRRFLERLMGRAEAEDGEEHTVEEPVVEERPAKEPVPKPMKPEPEPAPCPYCGVILEPRPKRKKKCPHCAQYVFVRRGTLLTKEEAAIDDWLKQVDHLHVTRKAFDRQRQKLGEQFGSTPSVNDTAWRILNNLLMTRQRHHDQQLIYLEMARIVRAEGKRDFRPYLAEAAKHELLELKEGGFFDRVTVTTCNDEHVCRACRALTRETFTIDEALATLPVPNNCQSEEGCRCGYIIADY
jgi:hypothetical protein